MLPIDTLYMVPRDMPLKAAADVLAEVARDRGYRLVQAAILSAAAALNPEAYGAEADKAALEISEPSDAYEAIIRSALASLNSARHETVDGARKSFKRAYRIACLADRTQWFAYLIYCTREALERAGLLPLPECE